VYSNSKEIHNPLKLDTARAIVHVPFVKSGKKSDVQVIAKVLSLKTAITDENANYVWAQINNETFNLKALQTKESEVPQLIGMGLKDALTILENQKIGVKVIGRGVIKKQSLTAGTKVFKGSTITIELS
jgi:cell division protein FtsI (penicillin-binding protein 3)